MLTKESSRGFNPMNEYPTYLYQSKSGKREYGNCSGSRIVPPRKGYREVVRYQDEDAHFTNYLQWIEEEHRELSDEKMLEHPYGIFIGNWRNARWQDEILRRGLIV